MSPATTQRCRVCLGGQRMLNVASAVTDPTISTIDACDLSPDIQAPSRPLRVMFVQTIMPVGGAEMLTVNLIRGLDRRRFAPELCCLKYPGPLGEWLADEIPVHHDLLSGKYDLRVLPRFVRLLRNRQIDAVITV